MNTFHTCTCTFVRNKNRPQLLYVTKCPARSCVVIGCVWLIRNLLLAVQLLLDKAPLIHFAGKRFSSPPFAPVMVLHSRSNNQDIISILWMWVCAMNLLRGTIHFPCGSLSVSLQRSPQPLIIFFSFQTSFPSFLRRFDFSTEVK